MDGGGQGAVSQCCDKGERKEREGERKRESLNSRGGHGEEGRCFNTERERKEGRQESEALERKGRRR